MAAASEGSAEVVTASEQARTDRTCGDSDVDHQVDGDLRTIEPSVVALVEKCHHHLGTRFEQGMSEESSGAESQSADGD